MSPSLRTHRDLPATSSEAARVAAVTADVQRLLADRRVTVAGLVVVPDRAAGGDGDVPTITLGQLADALARGPLWAIGADFDHGTGHGVGAYLSVHEGPQRISKLGTTPLLPGMILSNEPGYYRPGHFGIRIENLIYVRDLEPVEGGDQDMMSFETLTFVPIDRKLIAEDLLTREELRWLDDYHARTRDLLMPLMEDDAARQWLIAATEPLAKLA